MIKIFLGGTCGNSTWRDELIPIMKRVGVDFYNPVIKGRKRIDVDRMNEIDYRKKCDYVLYVITPDMRGVYSIAEVIDDSNKRPEKTLYLYIEDGRNYPIEGMEYSLGEVGEMVERNGGKWLKSWDDLVEFINKIGDNE